MKPCNVCSELKPEEEYLFHKPGKRRNTCRECMKKRSAEFNKNGPKTFVLTDPAAVWLTRRMGPRTYWQTMGEWMMGDRDARPVS